MKTFKQLMVEIKKIAAESEIKREKSISKLVELFEHEIYKRIPGTSNSYRQDSTNINTLTQRHSHTYAKLNGRGNELYSVNFDGSGHDGSSGIQIPSAHADFFRSNGYKIKADNILESLDIDNLQDGMCLIFMEDV